MLTSLIPLLALPTLLACELPTATAQPLADRWALTIAALSREPAFEITWVGWSIERSRESVVMSNTGPANLRGRDRGSLAELVGPVPEVDRRVAFLFAFPPGASHPEEIVGTRLRSIYAPIDVGDGRVVWLGEADDAESVALLESIFPRIASREVRTEFGPMIALHDDPALVVPVLRRIVMGEDHEDVRAEAMAWIGYQLPDRAAILLVEEVFRGTPTYRVLDEALTALDLDDGLSSTIEAQLLRLLEHHPDPEARALVTEALGEAGGRRFLSALEKAARSDPSPQVRAEALDALEEARS